MRKGQALLIIVFTLTFALFSLLIMLVPIRDKIIRIKEMESIYQAISNAEKGLELALFDIFKDQNFSLLSKSSRIENNVQNCAGMTYQNYSGDCIMITYTPQNGDEFKVNYFVFQIMRNGELYIISKSISDGFVQRITRSVLLGSME